MSKVRFYETCFFKTIINGMFSAVCTICDLLFSVLCVQFQDDCQVQLIDAKRVQLSVRVLVAFLFLVVVFP